MTGVDKVYPGDLIDQMAKKMKGKSQFSPPEWAPFVKTGVHKERPPVDADWWYMRVSAILRSVDKLGPIGVQKLRVKYGGKQDRGYKTEKFAKGSGNIVRKSLQQLEKAGFIKQTVTKGKKGRVITAEGKKFMNDCIAELEKKKDGQGARGDQAEKASSPKPAVARATS